MLVSLVIPLAFVVALSCIQCVGSLKSYTQDKRITNGQNTNISEANYYVFFTCQDVVCGATIVSVTRVITAAHCVLRCKPDEVTMYMGLNMRSELNNAAQYKAKSVFKHPDYERKGLLQYDIAVVYVNGRIETNGNVGMIPYGTSYPPRGDYVMCLGYGVTQTGRTAERLQRTWNLIKYYNGNLLMTDSKESSIMSGDSGGPCIYDNKLAGVIVGLYSSGDLNVLVNVASDEILSFVRSHT